jgi:hypothetical protein
MMQPLLRVFAQGGILMLPMVLITLVLAGIVLRALWHLYVRGGSNAVAIQSCLDSLVFWGGFAVVIGVLGSAIGYHRVINAVIARGILNPRALWIGTAEGMVSTIAGLLVLMAAGAAWYLLRWQHLRIHHHSR